MAVIFDAVNERGEYSQIAIHGPSENSRARIIIVENYKNIIETDDYNILSKYTKFENIAENLKDASGHIKKLYDYISFISERLQLSQYADLPEFKLYRHFALGSRLNEYFYIRGIEKAEKTLSAQRRYIESSIYYKDKSIKFVKWALGIIATAMVAICVCFVVNISVSKQSYSRYIKSGSTVIDTKNNSVLRRTNDGWEWQPMKK